MVRADIKTDSAYSRSGTCSFFARLGVGVPGWIEHEDFTEKIVLNTEIADFINEIGKEFVAEYGEDYNITPELICSIYQGKVPAIPISFF
jgi:hypothetical protein